MRSLPKLLRCGSSNDDEPDCTCCIESCDVIPPLEEFEWKSCLQSVEYLADCGRELECNSSNWLAEFEGAVVVLRDVLMCRECDRRGGTL